MLRMIDMTGRRKNAQHRLFPEHGRQERDTDVDVPLLSRADAEMTVLRQTALGDVLKLILPRSLRYLKRI